jgi:hypothetical protein
LLQDGRFGQHRAVRHEPQNGFSLKRQLDAPAGAVIGTPGKTERCGSNSTCVLLVSAKKACLRQACTLHGRGRCGLTARTARKEEQRRLAP